MNEELIKRAEDLASRCARTGSVTATAFLTPAEQYELRDFRPRADCAVRFHGGVPGAERACAFFLPDWMDDTLFDPGETLRCALDPSLIFTLTAVPPSAVSPAPGSWPTISPFGFLLATGVTLPSSKPAASSFF